MSSSCSRTAGSAERGGSVVADLEVALERVREVLRHGERREDPRVLERPAEAHPRPLRRAPASVTSTPSSMHAARRRVRRSPESTSNSVVLPAPFGPMRPRISPWLHVRGRRRRPRGCRRSDTETPVRFEQRLGRRVDRPPSSLRARVRPRARCRAALRRRGTPSAGGRRARAARRSAPREPHLALLHEVGAVGDA